jgi:hypothetical protein
LPLSLFESSSAALPPERSSLLVPELEDGLAFADLSRDEARSALIGDFGAGDVDLVSLREREALALDEGSGTEVNVAGFSVATGPQVDSSVTASAAAGSELIHGIHFAVPGDFRGAIVSRDRDPMMVPVMRLGVVLARRHRRPREKRGGSVEK